MTAARLAPLFVVCTLLVSARADAQTRSTAFDEPSEIRVVGTLTPGVKVPAVVFLPATGGASEDMFERAAPSMPVHAYVAILPKGRFASSDYLPGFSSFVSWMETRVLADVATARAAQPIDPERLYLYGFSLGGDTAWALLLRHPELFRGAVVLGSRASAQPRGTTLTTMRTRDVRIAFGMGSSDDATRVSGMTRASEAMQRAQIHTVFRRYEGAHSLPSDASTLGELATFVMSPS